MDNITRKVWDIINTDPIIRGSVLREIANKRSLAAYIIKKHELDVSLNAVISAIRRYEGKSEGNIYKEALDVIGSSTMSSQNGIVSLTLTKDEATERILPKLFNVVEIEKHQRLRIIQADESVKVIIDKKNLDKVLKLIPEKNLRKISDDLAEVIVHLDKRTWKTPGVASVLTTELSVNEINIEEIMSCIPEIIIFFKEKDLMNAYNVLYKISL